MIIFYCLIAFLLGVFSCTTSLYFLITLPIFVCFLYFKYKKDKRYILILIPLSFFVLGFIRPLLFIDGFEGYINNEVGIVYKAEAKYFVVATLKGNYYIPLQGYEVGDIIRITGKTSRAIFSHYENSFDFSSYLSHRFVNYQIEYCESSLIFKTPLRINSFKNYVLAYLDESSRVLGSSMIFGDSISSLSSYKELQNLGLTRLLSVSGFHISYIFHLINERYQGRKFETRIKIAELGVTVIFLLLTGFKFAFLRISFDLILKLIMKKKKIFLSRPSYLSLLIISLLLFNPYYLFEYGFIYTFIILFFMMIIPEFKKVPKRLKTPLTFILSYFLLIPINAYINYEINLLGVIVSLVFLPIIVSLFLITLTLLFIPQLGLFIRYPLNFLLYVMNGISNLKISIVTGRPNIIFVYCIYLIIVLAIYFNSIRLVKYTKVFLSLSIGSLCLLFVPRFIYQDQIHFIDVGQGDSTLVTVNNKSYLFDTGGSLYNDLATNCLIPYFKRNKISSLEAVFITHRDYDHYGALASLSENFEVNNIYYNYDVSSMDFSGINIKNLNQYRMNEEENYDSGVYYLTIKNKNVLIMGDAPIAIEKKIMADNIDLKVDILKVGHHGSNTSSSYTFLKTMNPDKAIISCGYDNRYGHPSSEVISSLESLNIKYYRTDLSGTITFNI